MNGKTHRIRNIHDKCKTSVLSFYLKSDKIRKHFCNLVQNRYHDFTLVLQWRNSSNNNEKYCKCFRNLD